MPDQVMRGETGSGRLVVVPEARRAREARGGARRRYGWLQVGVAATDVAMLQLSALLTHLIIDGPGSSTSLIFMFLLLPAPHGSRNLQP